MNMDIKYNLDWSGWFMTMSERMRKCESEEQLYRQLRNFKDEFNSAYGKLSRSRRNRKQLDI